MLEVLLLQRHTRMSSVELPTLGLFRLKKGQREETLELPLHFCACNSPERCIDFVNTYFCVENYERVQCYPNAPLDIIGRLVATYGKYPMHFLSIILGCLVIPAYNSVRGWKHERILWRERATEIFKTANNLPTWHRIRFDVYVFAFCLSEVFGGRLHGNDVNQLYSKISEHKCIFEKLNEELLVQDSITRLIQTMKSNPDAILWTAPGIAKFFNNGGDDSKETIEEESGDSSSDSEIVVADDMGADVEDDPLNPPTCDKQERHTHVCTVCNHRTPIKDLEEYKVSHNGSRGNWHTQANKHRKKCKDSDPNASSRQQKRKRQLDLQVAAETKFLRLSLNESNERLMQVETELAETRNQLAESKSSVQRLNSEPGVRGNEAPLQLAIGKIDEVSELIKLCLQNQDRRCTSMKQDFERLQRKYDVSQSRLAKHRSYFAENAHSDIDI